jgi:hypothetical protein
MDRKSVEEDYGARRDPEYWHIRFPTDDLDRFMWGESGVPSVSTKAVKQQDWSDNNQSDNYHCGDSSNSVMEDSPSLAASETSLDNVVFATLESPGNNSTSSTESPLPDKILLEDIVWKQRSGLGKYSFGLFMDAWEKKRVVLLDSGLLRYYDVDMDGVNSNDPKSTLDPQKCHTKQVPLGEIDLKCHRECTDDDCESSPQSRYSDGVTVQARDRPDDPGPTPFEIDITRSESNEILWRLCFESQSIQILWLSTLKSMTPVESSDGLANHGFAAGDHIIRWDFLLLPVPYPIQIHGIVLEVGRNCVIIADFGLASSYQRDEVKDDSHDVIMAAWEKIKPREKKRLNVVVITDLKEIRKWSKINYAGGGQGEKSSSKAMDFITSFLPKAKTTQAKIHDIVTEEIDTELTSCDDKASKYVEGEPEWIRPGYRPRKSKGATIPISDDGQSVFSIDRPEDRSDRELPKSDSANLVLARTHFVLEHEGLLPPYHVFYSNSECIAVWCKTGRWSTLQAAVYLVSTSVGWTKSATLITMSVAAAHAVLLPALAVGGLAVAGAPLLYLRKSQEQWDKTTMRLTDEFWRHAEPPVFVEAIKYWAKLEESQKSKSHLRVKSLD